jgi:hypothetical protein
MRIICGALTCPAGRLGCGMHNMNFTIRFSPEDRQSLDALASKVNEDFGFSLTSSDLVRAAAKRLLASPGELFKPPAVEHRP